MFLETKPTKSAVVRVSNQTTFSGETDVFFFQMEDNCLTKIQGGGGFLLRTRSFGRDLVFIRWLVKVYCPEKKYFSSLMLCLWRSILNRCTQPIKRHTKCMGIPMSNTPKYVSRYPNYSWEAWMHSEIANGKVSGPIVIISTFTLLDLTTRHNCVRIFCEI